MLLFLPGAVQPRTAIDQGNDVVIETEAESVDRVRCVAGGMIEAGRKLRVGQQAFGKKLRALDPQLFAPGLQIGIVGDSHYRYLRQIQISIGRDGRILFLRF